MNESVLVTGSSGLLGSNLTTQLRKKGYRVVTTYRSLQEKTDLSEFVDLTVPYTIEEAIAKTTPDVIIHAAALTNLDYCELHADEAVKANSEATKSIADLGAKLGSFVVYVSTDYVFDGKQGNYAEEDSPNPVNVYGESKLQGERHLQDAGGAHAIVRPSVIYGSKPSSGKENFALWLIGKLMHEEKVSILTDQFVSPTLATSLAEMMVELVERRLHGTFHLSGAERVDRYSFSKRLAAAFGLDDSLLVPARLSAMKWVAKRPADSSLDVSKAAGALSCKPIGLDEAFQRLKLELEW